MTTCRGCSRTVDIVAHRDVVASSTPTTSGPVSWTWYLCQHCGCHTSDQPNPDVQKAYSAEYRGGRVHWKDWPGLIEEYNVNMDHFDSAFGGRNKAQIRIIEVGCCECAGIQAMLNRGYDGFGWDVAGPAPDGYAHRTAYGSEYLSSDTYDAVLSRETIEHVADWKSLLAEMVRSVTPGGVLQVQTPRPCSDKDTVPYQHDHLVIFSPGKLIDEIEACGMDVYEARYWHAGQLIMARKNSV